MISMNNVGSAAQAGHYFSKDNYYTLDEGLAKSEWFGKGAEELGLTGQIEYADFLQILAGKVGDQELGKYRVGEDGEAQREHRPGTDMTFSAPKSVSLLAEVAGIKEVRDAHEEAVKEALTYIEKNLAYTRQGKDGQIERVGTGNLAVAMFRHNTSRGLDPQTHTHAVIMNATLREDGQWRSLMNDEIFNSQRLIGAIYTSALAEKIQALGYDIYRTDDRGNFEIAGISRDHVEQFSQRRAEIIEALKGRGVDIDGATAQQKEDATLRTRASKVDVDHEQLINDWRKQAMEAGIRFGEIVNAASLQKEGGEVNQDRLTGRQALEFAAAHHIEREAVISGRQLLATAIEHGAGRVGPKEVVRAMEKLEHDGHLIRLPSAGEGVDGLFTTKKMLNSEQWALAQVRNTQQTMPEILPKDSLEVRLAQIEKEQGFAFKEGQREAITVALASKDQFVGSQGLAGTGKTTMLDAMNRLAVESGYVVKGMAPTGAAAKVMQTEANIKSDTVSMFMIRERTLQQDIEFAKNHIPDFVRQKELWVVDESSFLSQRQKSQLDNMALKAGARVVYLGDVFQLQAVEAGKPFELAQKDGMQTSLMTEINRQKTPEMKAVVDAVVGRDKLAPGEKLTNVALVNNGRAFDIMDKSGMIKEVKPANGKRVEESDVIHAIINRVVELSPTERERTIVITPYNADRVAINNGVRVELQNKGELDKKDVPASILESKGWTRAMMKEAQYYKPGAVIRFGRDYTQVDAKNGEYATVERVDAQARAVHLIKNDGTRLVWQPSKHNKVEVYDQVDRQIAQGDKIRFTRGDQSQNVKNGEVGKVVSLDGKMAMVQVSDNRILPMDLNQQKHWDHAYASTVHASQGSTKHRTIFHVPSQDESKSKEKSALHDMARVFGDRSFYVGTTRASHEMEVYTANKAGARVRVMAKQDKSSAVEHLQKAQAENHVRDESKPLSPEQTHGYQR